MFAYHSTSYVMKKNKTDNLFASNSGVQKKSSPIPVPYSSKLIPHILSDVSFQGLLKLTFWTRGERNYLGCPQWAREKGQNCVLSSRYSIMVSVWLQIWYPIDMFSFHDNLINRWLIKKNVEKVFLLFITKFPRLQFTDITLGSWFLKALTWAIWWLQFISYFIYQLMLGNSVIKVLYVCR